MNNHGAQELIHQAAVNLLSRPISSHVGHEGLTPCYILLQMAI
jgi:hypothetical protein